MPRTQHTKSMCFHKNNCPKLVLFYFLPLEIVDQDREPSEKPSPQSSFNVVLKRKIYTQYTLLPYMHKYVPALHLVQDISYWQVFL